MVVVDTSVWVQFLRVKSSPEHLELARLLRQRKVAMVGPVLAEVIQGAKDRREFDHLSELLQKLPYVDESQGTWSRVGTLAHILRQRGRSVAMIDLVIAALAIENDCSVYTLDEHFQRIPGLKLHKVGADA